MAELNTDCCGVETQASCCEPEAKADCCGKGTGCGCAAGNEVQAGDIRETVRQRYAASAVELHGSATDGLPDAVQEGQLGAAPAGHHWQGDAQLPHLSKPHS